MRQLTRRKVDLAGLVFGALCFAGAAGLGAAIGDRERVAHLWTTAVITTATADSETTAGTAAAQISEVIDYDFASSARHGIFREIPGLAPGAPVSVTSETAPDAILLTPTGSSTRIRVGDPQRTINGRHRYRIAYPLNTLVVGPSTGAPTNSTNPPNPTSLSAVGSPTVAWNVVGTSWEVPIETVAAHVVAPFQLLAPRCVKGAFGSTDTCQFETVAPGHLRLSVKDLAPGEGVTVYATVGSALRTAPPTPAAPTGQATDPGSGVLPTAGTALAGALIGAAIASRLVRRAGRERVAPGGAADAAFARLPPPGAPATATISTGAASATADPDVRLDLQELARHSTIEFTPPAQLDPARGGIVLHERVGQNEMAAWLVNAANEGYLDFDPAAANPTLVRLERRDGPTTVILDAAFAGRDRLVLGGYDAPFARAWQALRAELEGWRKTSALWDQTADRRRHRCWALGLVVLLVGLALTAVGAGVANRAGNGWLVAVAGAAALGAAGLAAVVRAWELRVRSIEGSALWLRLESFRRFLAESEASHVEQAAQLGVLRQYIAWALALGEIERWSRAMAASSTAVDPVSASYASIAPALASAAASSTVKPSSSGGSGGSGGGSVGGGGGGGGGGSW